MSIINKEFFDELVCNENTIVTEGIKETLSNIWQAFLKFLAMIKTKILAFINRLRKKKVKESRTDDSDTTGHNKKETSNSDGAVSDVFTQAVEDGDLLTIRIFLKDMLMFVSGGGDPQSLQTIISYLKKKKLYTTVFNSDGSDPSGTMDIDTLSYLFCKPGDKINRIKLWTLMTKRMASTSYGPPHVLTLNSDVITSIVNMINTGEVKDIDIDRLVDKERTGDITTSRALELLEPNVKKIERLEAALKKGCPNVTDQGNLSKIKTIISKAQKALTEVSKNNIELMKGIDMEKSMESLTLLDMFKESEYLL